MKIQLPNGEQDFLDETLTLDEKRAVVEELANHWDEVIINNWESLSVKYFLDTLSNYLVWHKEPVKDLREDKRWQDKYVLSRKKMEMLIRYKKSSKTQNFTDLNAGDKEILFGERGRE